MFFVLIRYVYDGVEEWEICPHGVAGLKKPFSKRADAVDYATKMAMDSSNAFDVVELIGSFERSVTVTLHSDLGVAMEVKDAHDANSKLSRLP